MILDTENCIDHHRYSASLANVRKRVQARFEGGDNELVAAMSSMMGPFSFDLRYEGAVWRRPMQATNLLRAPLFLVGVDDALKRITLEEFGAHMRHALVNANVEALAAGESFEGLLGPGFTAMRIVRRHLPSFRRVPVLLFTARGHERPFSWNIAEDS